MKKLVPFLFLFVHLFVYAQTETVVIEWNKDHGQLSFPHALYEDRHNSLPYFTRKIAWEDQEMVPRFTVEVTGSSPVVDGDLPVQQSEVEFQEPRYSYELAGSARTPYVMLKLFPFIPGEDGTLLRIDTFLLGVEWEMALAPLKSAKVADWNDHSVLASGAWHRVSVEQGGIHKLTYGQLQEIGLQNPASVRVLGSGARLLPENFANGHVDDLEPVAIYMEKGTDGLFGPGDFILFYAEGPVGWFYSNGESFYNHRLHPHSLKGYYFLTDSQGPADKPEDAALSEDPVLTVTSYDYRVALEEETYNLINSGKEWYGDIFGINLEYNYPFRIQDLIQGEPLKAKIVVAARSGETSSFSASANGGYLGDISINPTDLSTYTATYAYEKSRTFSFVPGSSDITLTLSYDRPDNDSEGWLNRITLNGRCDLTMNNRDQLEFRDTRSTGPGAVSEFRLQTDQEVVIWDITDPSGAMNIPWTPSGSDAVFTLATDMTREFVAFDPQGDFPSPGFGNEELGSVDNQDLHGLSHADMVIIAPEIFLEQATRLAQHRQNEDGLDVEVVLQQQVFNEFSSGTPDVTAIRNFMKMFYDRSEGTSDKCRYLLLFGDGTYANRDLPDLKENTNLILTYQSNNSLQPINSFVSDDFFGILETGASMHSGDLNIGIGRLPVSTVEEAENLVDKIISYDDLAHQGDWRNQLCFIGDDEDANLHMRQADELARYVSERYPSYNINKIYLDAYQQERTATGFRYPLVNTTINNQVNRGALIVNYTGHGGPSGLAHEQVVTPNDILSWSNSEMLPLFMTATCEFSRYDEYDQELKQESTSAGEDVLLNTEGGGIGLFTTTRLVYAQPNHELNEKFYEVVFEKNENQENYRLGDIILYSKNRASDGVNKRNFSLLGDPSMRLSYPEHRVVTDSINGVAIQVLEDTLEAFNWVTVSGHLETRDGVFMEQFNGTVYPIVFDKEKNIETLGNDKYSPYNFKARNNILYSGKSTVKNGRFSFGFYVPKDISYAFGPGKISYYSNDSVVDAHGSCESFMVGGIGKEHTSDLEPPEIAIYMNDSFFISGGITDGSPELLVFVSDNYGINTTGNGIGHDLTAILDSNRVEAVILNEFFQASTDSYNSGVIRYPYSNLSAGEHQITVKIWDIHNNSAQSTIRFLVVESEEMLIEQLLNYPNPFRELTRFSIQHNRPDSEMKLVLTIHNLSGEMVRKIDRRVYSGGYRVEPLQWDGTSSNGSKLGSGIYLYRVTLTTEGGESATDSGKLVLVR